MSVECRMKQLSKADACSMASSWQNGDRRNEPDRLRERGGDRRVSLLTGQA